MNLVQLVDEPTTSESIWVSYMGDETEVIGGESFSDVLVIETESVSLTAVSSFEIIDLTTPLDTTVTDVNEQTVSLNAADIQLDSGETLEALIIQAIKVML